MNAFGAQGSKSGKKAAAGRPLLLFCLQKTQAAQQARENGAGEDEAFLYGLGEVVKRIGGQQLEEYFRSKAGELFTRGEVQAMSPREISENYDAIRESMGWGFAVGAPARRSRDGSGKMPAPAGPMTGRAVSPEAKRRAI